jgi:hypothetical protein
VVGVKLIDPVFGRNAERSMFYAFFLQSVQTTDALGTLESLLSLPYNPKIFLQDKADQLGFALIIFELLTGDQPFCQIRERVQGIIIAISFVLFNFVSFHFVSRLFTR